MNRNKARPSLSSVLGASSSAAARPVTPVTEQTQTPDSAPERGELQEAPPSLQQTEAQTAPLGPSPSLEAPVPTPDSPRPRSGGRVQLNVLVSPELRRLVRMRALEQEEDVSDLVARALTDWLEKTKTPPAR